MTATAIAADGMLDAGLGLSSRMIKPLPDGYRTLTPYLYVRDCRAALAFYARALGAKELSRMEWGEGKIGHAEMQIGDSKFMLADEFPDWGIRSPLALGGNGSSLMIYVTDVDAAFQRAVDAGAKIARPLENKFYGDRAGTIEDPFGHQWTIATHIEDVSPAEMARRSDAESAKMSQQQ